MGRFHRIKKLPPRCVPTLFEDAPTQNGLGYVNAQRALLLNTSARDYIEFDDICQTVLMALGDHDWDGRLRLNPHEMQYLLQQVSTANQAARPAALAAVQSAPTNFVNVVDQLGNASLTALQGAVQQVSDAANLAGLSHTDIVNFGADEENRRSVLQNMPKPIHGILNNDLVSTALKEFDADGNGILDKKEWHAFINCLEYLHTRYTLGSQFAVFQAFYGRGQPWQLTRGVDAFDLQKRDFETMAGRFWYGDGLGGIDGMKLRKLQKQSGRLQFGQDPDGCIPPGWKQDLYYYFANNHPFFGIFLCDPTCPLSNTERVAMEIATYGFVLLTQALKEYRTSEGSPMPRFAGLLDTVLSMVMWWTFFLLFTCPKCGRIDFSSPEATKSQIRRANAFQWAGNVIGYSIMMLWIFFLAFVIYEKSHGTARSWYFNLDREDGGADFLLAFLTRIRSYFISLGLEVFIYFNPFVAWGQTDPQKKQNTIGDLIGLGQWRIEKQRFQRRCADIGASREEPMKEAGLLDPAQSKTPLLGCDCGTGAPRLEK